MLSLPETGPIRGTIKNSFLKLWCSHFKNSICTSIFGFPGGSVGKESACIVGDPGSIPWVWEVPLEKGRATHSSILAWRIPWTEQPGGLQSTGSQESNTT